VQTISTIACAPTNNDPTVEYETVNLDKDPKEALGEKFNRTGANAPVTPTSPTDPAFAIHDRNMSGGSGDRFEKASTLESGDVPHVPRTARH
jgi:hypothetical protein